MRGATAIACASVPLVLAASLLALPASLLAIAAAAPPPAGDTQAVQLPSSLRPLLEAHCVDCHEGSRAKGGLDLQAVLASGEAESSVLRALRARLRRQDMPPVDEPMRPNDAEYRAAVAAITEVVPLAAREVPLARRLNRAQYARAVRDVLGVPQELPLALLPADEIGEGFDTTASTLALPPLLVEKYLDAAERIAVAALPPESWSRTMVVESDRLERVGQGGTYDGTAWLATNGTLTARFAVAHRGRFRVVVDACGQFAGSEDPRLDLLVDGTAVGTASISTPAGSTQQVTNEVELVAGEHAVTARFANDFWDPKAADPKRRDRNLGVTRITLEGPLGPTPETPFERRIDRLAPDSPSVLRLRAIAETIGEELFRRPLERSEVHALASTAREAVGVQSPFVEQARALVTALLVDPRFLLRIERPGTSGATDRQPIAPTDLAARLSFFLWSSVPDAELRRLAATGELAQEGVMIAQVRRMLADPRSASLAERFATQWLGIDGLESRQVDPVLFPLVTPELLDSMRRETESLFGEVVRGERPIRALVDARTTRVDARLAAHYGLVAPEGDRWEQREVDPARGSGVLGHAAVLLATSNPTRTSPVKRGKWVLRALLDEAPPPPPPGVPQLPEVGEPGHVASIRELMAAHRANPDCASCHVRMDAIGLAFESADVDGRIRPGADDSSELPDGSILRGVAGVAAMLADDRAFERALARQLLVYALGRGTAEADEDLIDRIAAVAVRTGSFASVVEEIVRSDAFGTRATLAKAGK